MRIQTTKRGMSLLELMAVVAIVIIAVSAGSVYYGPTIRRNELLNQLKYVRAAFLKAKSNAMEHTAAVKLTVDPLSGKILILRDQDRDGSFLSAEVVMGLSLTEGMPSPYRRHVRPDSRKGGAELPIWFQSGVFFNKNAESFTENSLIIMPTGRVHDPVSLAATGGTFFYYTREKIPSSEVTHVDQLDSNNARYYGAIHITAMGDVRLAFLKDEERDTGAFNGWKWLD